jgi:hypothetical protein
VTTDLDQQEAEPVQFKVPVASVVAATLIAGIAGAYAFVGGTANLNSSPSSATVTASAAGLKATGNGATAGFDATGDVPSGSIELPIPPVVPMQLPAMTASVPGTGAAVNVAPGKVSVTKPNSIPAATSGPPSVAAGMAIPGMNIPGLADALKLVPAAQLPQVTSLLSSLPAPALNIIGQLLKTVPGDNLGSVTGVLGSVQGGGAVNLSGVLRQVRAWPF